MIRRNIITGAAIVFAPERAGRPNAFVERAARPLDASRAGETPAPRVARDPSCPFCPGNEHETPPEVARAGERGSWRVRVFPNKYPAFPEHEVIVESPQHDAAFARIEHAADVVAMYVDRYRSMSARAGVEYCAIFKNHGTTAGASIEHLHSQVAGVTFLPPRLAAEAAAFASAAECPLCRALDEHRREGLVIGEDQHFISFAPSGSTFAYQQWIVPKRHQNEITTLRSSETESLASMLRKADAAIARVSSSHNWLPMSFPRVAAAHCYIDVFPRVTNVAGFELETGTFIDVVDPAAAARLLRES